MKAAYKTILIIGIIGLLSMTPLNTNAAVSSLIIDFEVGDPGNLKLEAYPDTNNFWQIGFGSTWNYTQKRYVKPGDKITEAEAYTFLNTEIAEKTALINKEVKVPLTKNMKDSLISLVYNIGSTAFKNSTLLKLLNQGESKKVVADQFLRWVYADGVKNQGLINRRNREKTIFLT